MRHALLPLALAAACAPTSKSGSFVVAGPIEQVTLMADAGELRVLGEDRDSVHVDRSLDGYVEEVTDTEGGRFSVSWEGRGDPAVHATVRVPRDAEIAVLWGAGPISLSDLAGPLSVSLSAGTLMGSALGSGEVEVELGSGEVALTFSSAPEALLVTQADGPVSVEVPSGAYALDLSTRAGEVWIDGVTDSPAAERSIALHLGAGDIALTGVEGL